MAKKKSAKQNMTDNDVQGKRRSANKNLAIGDDVLQLSKPPVPRGMQSTIEEMVSSNEELQSLNEQLERRVAQRTAELEQREREFRTLVANVPALFSFVGPDQRYRYVNRRYEELFQQPASEIVGKTVEQLLGSQRYEVVRPHVEAVLQGEEVRYEAEFDFAGGPHCMYVNYVPHRDEDGHVQGFFTLVTDITERKQIERTLTESKDRMRAILNTASDAIITIDRRGIIKSVNPATEQMFGYLQDDLIGQNVKILMPSPYCDEHDEYVARYLETGEARIIGIGREVVGRHKDGSTFPVGLAVSEVDHLKLFTGIIRDMSAVKELQKQVLEIAGEEDRRIGHELHDNIQQQLTGLGLLAKTVADRLTAAGAKNAGLSHTADLATNVAQGINEAAKQVHLLSRGLVPVEVDAQGLRSALTDLAARITEQYGVQCNFLGQRTVTVEDNFAATHLYRIAQEAVNNAIKHGRANRIDISLAEVNETITLKVLDNGSGIGEKRDRSLGMGLRIMQYRAGLIGAMVQVAPGECGGTQVVCTVLRRGSSR